MSAYVKAIARLVDAARELDAAHSTGKKLAREMDDADIEEDGAALEAACLRADDAHATLRAALAEYDWTRPS